MSSSKCSWIVMTLLLSGLVMISVGSCHDDKQIDGNARVGIVVTLLPQAEFVEKVGGDKVMVTVMVPSGANPHTYEPIPSQMVAVAEADIYVQMGSGVEFELTWMDKLIAQNKDMLVVDCSEGVELIEMGTSHEHEGEEDAFDHEKEGMDPHIWISPNNAMTIVQNIYEGLIQIDPDNTSFYEFNRNSYLESLSQLDHDIDDGLVDVTNRIFMVYHPAFGYLAHDYDLIMLPVEEEGKEPTAAGLSHLIDQVNEHNIKVIFAEPQFDPKSARTIANEIGGTVMLIDPLAKGYIENLRIVVEALTEAME